MLIDALNKNNQELNQQNQKLKTTYNIFEPKIWPFWNRLQKCAQMWQISERKSRMQKNDRPSWRKQSNLYCTAWESVKHSMHMNLCGDWNWNKNGDLGNREVTPHQVGMVQRMMVKLWAWPPAVRDAWNSIAKNSNRYCMKPSGCRCTSAVLVLPSYHFALPQQCCHCLLAPKFCLMFLVFQAPLELLSQFWRWHLL